MNKFLKKPFIMAAFLVAAAFGKANAQTRTAQLASNGKKAIPMHLVAEQTTTFTNLDPMTGLPRVGHVHAREYDGKLLDSVKRAQAKIKLAPDAEWIQFLKDHPHWKAPKKKAPSFDVTELHDHYTLRDTSYDAVVMPKRDPLPELTAVAITSIPVAQVKTPEPVFPELKPAPVVVEQPREHNPLTIKTGVGISQIMNKNDLESTGHLTYALDVVMPAMGHGKSLGSFLRFYVRGEAERQNRATTTYNKVQLVFNDDNNPTYKGEAGLQIGKAIPLSSKFDIVPNVKFGGGIVSPQKIYQKADFTNFMSGDALYPGATIYEFASAGTDIVYHPGHSKKFGIELGAEAKYTNLKAAFVANNNGINLGKASYNAHAGLVFNF